MGDKKDILDEIDELEDDKKEDNGEDFKVKKDNNSHDKIFTIIIVIIIIVALAMLYLFYKGTYIVSNKKDIQKGFQEYLEDNDYSYDELDDEEYYDDGYDEDIDDFEDEEYIEYDIDYQELKAREDKFNNELKANITATSQNRGIDNDLITVFHNGNQEIVSDFIIYALFYDKENKPIYVSYDYVSVIDPNMDYYVEFENVPDIYEKCEYVMVKEDFEDVYVSQRESVTFEQNSKNDELLISGKNNSDVDISEINFEILYYDQNNQVVYVDYLTEEDVKKNGKFELTNYLDIYDETGNSVPFNRYDVVLLNAFSYDD